MSDSTNVINKRKPAARHTQMTGGQPSITRSILSGLLWAAARCLGTGHRQKGDATQRLASASDSQNLWIKPPSIWVVLLTIVVDPAIIAAFDREGGVPA